MSPDPNLLRFLRRQLAAQEKSGLLTNAILEIGGRRPPRVNGRPLKLGAHAFTLLLILAALAKESPGDYFLTDDLLCAIEKRGRLLGELRLSWDRPTSTQMHSAVSELRAALREKFLNEDLVESVREKGYRLSTPAMNILTDISGTEILARFTLSPLPRGSSAEQVGSNGALALP